MSRLLIVSNRLPVTVRPDDGSFRVDSSTGGLAVGLAGPHERGDGSWIGWPGSLDALDENAAQRALAALRERRLVPVDLTPEEVKGFYESFSNGVLWPLFHYQTRPIPLEVHDFDVYESVNRRFADVVAEQYQPGDRIWVHDYQLLLVPGMLRERLPDARIGFFLHIPFPSSELFRILPSRERILEGMLGADLIGFHTANYLRHFASTALRLLGARVWVDRLAWKGREIHLGAFPMGIDAQAFAATAAESSVEAEVRALRGEEGTQLLLGIDRLDYTKGIPRRLLAFERLLEQHPELRERVRLVQVAVPSREDVEAYQSFRSETDELIGRIHGAYATARWVPVHWLYRSLEREDLVALYRAADVMLVTPLRDGMNLVAKEFAASRTDEDGVLVLSEFAGAASEMGEAISINPFDIASTAEAFHRALTLPEDERRERMRALRRRVFGYDIDRWVASFLEALEALGPVRAPRPLSPTPPEELASLVKELAGAPHLVLLLDYDGTLVPFAPTPERAVPDAELLELLERLTRRPRTEVHVVSGRERGSLERWLGDLPLAMHAEHGFASRPRGADAWKTSWMPPQTWREPVRHILEDVTRRTPGSLIEEKGVGLAWHYRGSDPHFGALQAKELNLHLTELLANLPVEILPGDQVLEVRPHGVHKGRIVGPVLESAPKDARILAIGDDRTDEDLFAALPESGIAVHVGSGASRARYRIRDVEATRALLRALLDAGAG